MARDVVIGGEGQAKLNNVDWEVTDLSLTENEQSQNITCTSNFDTTDKMTYGLDITTERRLEGELTLELDRNNRPWGTAALRAGGQYAGTLLITNLPSPYTILGTFKLGSMGIRMGGVTGVWQVTMPIRSQGKYIINGA